MNYSFLILILNPFKNNNETIKIWLFTPLKIKVYHG